jgi:DNA-binding NarL/FixJ family response regulator
VIVLSVHDEKTAISRALDAGAAGFVLKRTAATDRTEAVGTVLRGETYVSAVSGRRPASDDAKCGLRSSEEERK